MKFIQTFFITFLIGVSYLKGQNPSMQLLDGKKYEILDTSYLFSEAAHAIFYENNGQVFWNLRNEIRELDFDHCNHSFLFFLYIDTSGRVNHIQMLEGSTQSIVDTIVYKKVSSIQHVIP